VYYSNAQAEGELSLGTAWKIRPEDALLPAGALEMVYPS
jgi:hypothetical protein